MPNKIVVSFLLCLICIAPTSHATPDPLNDTFLSKFGKQISLSMDAPPANVGDLRHAMKKLKQALTFYEDYFGSEYPQDTYNLVATSHLAAGEIENNGLENINTAQLLWNGTHPLYKQVSIARLVAQSLAYEWFGGRDLWLRESFAVCMASLFEAEIFGKDFERIQNYQRLYTDNGTYAKRTQAVQRLHDLMGGEKFREGLQAYFKKGRFGKTSTEAFFSAMEGTSGIHLNRLVKSWLDQKDVPKRKRSGKSIPEKRHGDIPAYLQKPQKPTEEADPYARFETAHHYLLSPYMATYAFKEGSIPKDLRETIQARLNDKNGTVALGISWAMIDNRLSPDLSRAMAKAVWDTAKNLYRSLSKTDPIEAQLRRQLLTLLGESGRPEINSFLEKQLSSDLFDDQLGAIAGLLRSRATNRYEIFEKLLRQHRGKQQAKMELLQTLAATPRTDLFEHLNQFLLDETWVAKEDSTIPIYVWRSLHTNNFGVIYSQEGISTVLTFVKKNLNRPMVAREALRVLEETHNASPEFQQKIGQAMGELLALNPPYLVKSLAQTILKAVRGTVEK